MSRAGGTSPGFIAAIAGRTGTERVWQGTIAGLAAGVPSGSRICRRITRGKTSSSPENVLRRLPEASRSYSSAKCAAGKFALTAESCVVCSRIRTGWSMETSNVGEPPAITNEGGSYGTVSVSATLTPLTTVAAGTSILVRCR